MNYLCDQSIKLVTSKLHYTYLTPFCLITNSTNVSVALKTVTVDTSWLFSMPNDVLLEFVQRAAKHLINGFFLNSRDVINDF